jgi:phospholipase/lecithinase/hemolysin
MPLLCILRLSVYYLMRAPCPLGMRVHVLGVSTLALIVGSFTALGDPIAVNQIVAFGDSLTDTGNASIATLGVQPGAGYAYRTIPGLPFQVGEFTTGSSGLWVDQFAAKAGLPDPQPFLAPGGGTNYAVGGALTGSSLGDVGFQLGTYLAGKTTVPSTNLYSFWAGANDILSGDNPVTAANNLDTYIATIAAKGGKDFLWFNQPLLGDTPRGMASGQAAALNAASAAFDAQWSTDIASLETEFPGIVLVGVDIETLFNDIGDAPGTFTFDGLHPTSAAHGLIADLAFNDFEAATTPSSNVPEPASVALMLIGVGCALATRLKTKDRG